jgi:YidC/Oxa1 family membrane protein insertase
MKDSSEERRLLLAIALSLLVVTGYQLFLMPRPTTAPATPTPPAASHAPAPEAAALEPAPADTPPPQAEAAERRVEASSGDVMLAFSNRGARLLSWRLRAFHDERGRPEEMVQAAPGGPRPLDVETGEAALDARLRSALFVASADRLEAPGELRFEFSDGELAARKVYRLPAEGFLLEVEADVSRGGRAVPARLVWGPGVTNPTERETEVQGYVAPQAVVRAPGGVERFGADTLETPRSLPRAAWAGVESQYFAALLVPAKPAEVELRSAALAESEPAGRGAVAGVSMTPGAALKVYVGPKDWDTLHRLRLGLEEVVPIGDWIGPIVVPLLRLLRFVHGHVGNYGWSIVVLTVLINLVMGPLRHMSIANGMKMAKLAPEMRAIQERYRKVPALDPRRQEMQKEIGQLYARHGMSMGTQMLVGCLPMLLTLPFLFAFYRVLTLAVELRGAAFLWIPDLSHRDPLFLTPLLLGVSMFVMQKMTPSTLDPAQQRIMMIMPLMLVVMFFAAPAGLNLYWLASNLCSIVQQGVTLRLLRAAEARQRGDKGERRRT